MPHKRSGPPEQTARQLQEATDNSLGGIPPLVIRAVGYCKYQNRCRNPAVRKVVPLPLLIRP